MPEDRLTTEADPAEIDHVVDEEAEAEAAAESQVVEAGDVSLLSTGELAQVFHDIGDLLEVKGELVFKTVAYHRAADAIGPAEPIESLVDRADHALLRAKRAGRDRVIAG